MTFIGKVLTGTLLTELPPGFSLVCSKIPVAGLIDIQGCAGDSILFWDNGWNEDIYWGGGTWDFDPWIDIGKGFFYKNTCAAYTWIRNFNP